MQTFWQDLVGVEEVNCEDLSTNGKYLCNAIENSRGPYRGHHPVHQMQRVGYPRSCHIYIDWGCLSVALCSVSKEEKGLKLHSLSVDCRDMGAD